MGKKNTGPKSIDKQEFIRQIAVKAGKTAQETQIFLNAMESVVRDQLVANGIITLPGLLKIRKVVLPPKPERQLSCFDGKIRTYKAKPAKNVIRMKPLWQLKNAIEGSTPDGTSK